MVFKCESGVADAEYFKIATACGNGEAQIKRFNSAWKVKESKEIWWKQRRFKEKSNSLRRKEAIFMGLQEVKEILFAFLEVDLLTYLFF